MQIAIKQYGHEYKASWMFSNDGTVISTGWHTHEHEPVDTDDYGVTYLCGECGEVFDWDYFDQSAIDDYKEANAPEES